MRRALFAIMLLAVGAAANAGEARFEQHKSLTLKALAERQTVLSHETSCVQAAQAPDQLRACADRARLERETMGRELRQAAEQRHGGPQRQQQQREFSPPQPSGPAPGQLQPAQPVHPWGATGLR